MPFYEYQCSACHAHVEVLQKISDAPLRKCPTCGRQKLKRLLSAPVFRLKGGGWYETDFKSDAEARRNLAEHPEKEKEGKDAKDAKDAKDVKEGKDAKEAKDSTPAPAAKPPVAKVAKVAKPSAAPKPAKATRAAKPAPARSKAPAKKAVRR